MNKNIINAPEWANYLGEFMTELPVNCLFNKGVTGCGGTELALKNDKHTIIAMPFISLVNNKAEKEEHKGEVLPVHGNTPPHEIEEYIRTHKVWKIAVVYDSLPKVIKAFQDLDINPYEKCFLLADEYHVLFAQYVFRNKAIRELLDLAPNFKEVTYMTATPIEEEFMLMELKNLPIYEVVWPNKRKVTVVRQPVSSPQRYVSNLISKKLEDKSFENLHFFVNSIKFINNVLKRINLNPEDVKIVCADNSGNERKLGGYKIRKPSDKACKINFYTSTCFEGCDIFDREGKTYVVSEGKNPNTLYDISTLFIQIIGRIRDSEYGNEVYHIHSSSGYTGNVSYNEFKGIMDREYNLSASSIHEYNSESIHLRRLRVDKFRKEHFENRFIYVNDDYTFELDKNLLNKSLLDYKLKSEVYNKNTYLIQSYKDNGLDVRNSGYIKYSDKLKANNSVRGNFKEAIEEYCLLATTQNWGHNTERLNILRDRYKFISDAYYQLGMERIRELNYNTTLINRELIKISDKPLVKKIIELLVKKIGYQKPIDLDTAKKALKEVYEILGIHKGATASKLKDYFIIKEFPITRGGNTLKQIELIKEKTNLKELNYGKCSK